MVTAAGPDRVQAGNEARPTTHDPGTKGKLMGKQMAIVDYLVLDDGPPHLVAHRCSPCGARSTSTAATPTPSCGTAEFEPERVSEQGVVRTFTIVHRAAPGRAHPLRRRRSSTSTARACR